MRHQQMNILLMHAMLILRDYPKICIIIIFNGTTRVMVNPRTIMSIGLRASPYLTLERANPTLYWWIFWIERRAG